MYTLRIITLLLLFFSQFSTSTGENQNIESVITQSEKMANAIKSESLQSLEDIFADEASILPEYHQTVVGKPYITQYYEQFFEKSETLSYQKHPFEIQKFGEGFLELGTFKHHYKTPSGTTFHYNGKYMTFWELQNGLPKIKAHIWGASNYFEAKNLDFVSVNVPELNADISPSKWKNDIEEIRSYVYQAVLEGDAKTSIRPYADDAIYMPYYDPAFIGKTQIANYFYPHYEPGTVQRDSLMTSTVKIVDLGKYALKFGEYHVEWTQENKPHYIKGKGLSLYRRRDDGQIEIYRQMINHSMPPTPKE
jgi:ketosteroid isomerase-like protein